MPCVCVWGGALRSFQITLQGVSVKGAASLTLSHCLPPYSYAVLFTFPRSLPWRPSYTWLRGGLSRAREHFTMVALLSFLYQAVESFSDLCSPYCVLRLVDSQWRDRFYCVAKLLWMWVSIHLPTYIDMSHCTCASCMPEGRSLYSSSFWSLKEKIHSQRFWKKSLF